MASYGRVIARFKGFQAGYRVKGTVEFVPKNWSADAGAIFAPAPVIGYVREDGALYASEIFYSDGGEQQEEGIRLLASPVESGVVEYLVTPRLYDSRTGFAVAFRAFTLRVTAGATVDLAGAVIQDLKPPVSDTGGNTPVPTPPPAPPVKPVPDTPAPNTGGDVRIVSSANGVWALELPDGATITTTGNGEYVPHGISTAHTGGGNYEIGD
jgi:hypothetical protein|nr:MAG TPA: hypothetical protein [Caudoviricetes sp.]